MNFLKLVQTTANEAGHRTLNIQSVTNQRNVGAMFVDWVADAWVNLQNMARWEFMRKDAAFTMVAGQRDYTASQAGIADLLEWCDSRDSIAHLTITLADGSYVDCQKLPRQDFYDKFDRYAAVTRIPAYFCMLADGSLRFDGTPDQGGAVKGQYWKRAVTLVEDTDEPDMNPDWHRAIVGLALKAYAEYDESQPMMAKGRRIFNGIYDRMCITALPDLIMAPNPIAKGRR